VDSHGAFLRSQGETKEVTFAIASGDIQAAIDAGLEHNRATMLDLVRKLTFEAYRIAPDDIEKLRQVGYTDPQIAEAIYVAAMFAFFNRVADAFGIPGTGRLNAEDA
jgi:alkylhydroperoxidase family enzyme